MQQVIKFVSLLCVVAAALPAAQALSRVVYKNGNEETCDRVERIDDKVRIYLHHDNYYFEWPASQIKSIEALPDVLEANPPTETVKPAAAPKQPAVLTKEDLHEMLADAGSLHNVDIDLLASIVHAESGGRPTAVSRAGAQGLMQLMPHTATEVGVKDSMDPSDNVHGGTAYIDTLLTRYHENLSLALAAYNAGPAAVDRYHGIPPYRETQIYVARVIHEFNRRVTERNRTKPIQAQISSKAVSSK
jgi:soluble lytic murein transglycosylase-like protein